MLVNDALKGPFRIPPPALPFFKDPSVYHRLLSGSPVYWISTPRIVICWSRPVRMSEGSAGLIGSSDEGTGYHPRFAH
jgi:hypothetical protein